MNEANNVVYQFNSTLRHFIHLVQYAVILRPIAADGEHNPRGDGDENYFCS